MGILESDWRRLHSRDAGHDSGRDAAGSQPLRYGRR